MRAADGDAAGPGMGPLTTAVAVPIIREGVPTLVRGVVVTRQEWISRTHPLPRPRPVTAGAFTNSAG